MNREQAKEKIKDGISCSDYLQPAPNHSGNKGYICPYCGSGSHGRSSTGALTYYPSTNTWYCFSCSRGGDVIDLYRAQHGASYPEAVNALSEVIGITIDEIPTERRQTSPQSDFYDRNDGQTAGKGKPAEIEKKNPADFTAYYSICEDRANDPAALAYLQARGISKETAAAFHIGYDPEADPAAAPGAIRNEHKAHPTPRLIIPCAPGFYVARSIDQSTPTKYKALYPTGGSAALLNAAALYTDAAAGGVFVCEGWADALAFIETGRPAIATNGKGNGKLLLQQLQEHPAPGAAFIICHDNDPDGKAADTLKRAQELNDELQRAGYKSIVYNVAGDQHDANDALTKDPRAFIRNIDTALTALEKEKSRDELTDFIDKVTTEAYKPHATGLQFFDNLLCGGIVSQTLLLLLAAPGAGKTTLCQQLAETMAEHGTPVIYFNFEMSREQMLAKAISRKYYRGNGGDMGMLDVLQGYKWTDKDRDGISRTIEQYRRENYPYIRYNPDGVSADLNELLDYLDRQGQAAAAAGRPAPAAVIDYLHLLTADGSIDLQELIKRAVTGLKQYAVKYDTFVIGIIAANRDSTKSGRLTLESGRDSSNLEFTADYQLSLNYTEIDAGTVKPDEVEKVEELKRKDSRRMILRSLKTRIIPVTTAARLQYDTKHNNFTEELPDFEEAPDAPTFDGRPRTSMPRL